MLVSFRFRPRYLCAVLCGLFAFSCGPEEAPPLSYQPPATSPESVPPEETESAPANVTPTPLVLHGVTFPDGAVIFATGQHNVWRGIVSDITWVASREDAIGLMGWMVGLGADSPVQLAISLPRDPGVPEGAPPWAQSAIQVALKQEGELCLPCFDPVGQPVTGRGEGCACDSHSP